MSLSKKSDVKNHLSARRHKALRPFRPMVPSNVTDNLANELRDANYNKPASLQESGLRFYAVAPITTIDTLISSGNLTDAPAVKKPQA
jgi:hypothetical protein